MMRLHVFGLAKLAALGVAVAFSGAGLAATLDAGRTQSCAIAVGGTVKCWAANYDARFGEPTSYLALPTDVIGITGATAVATGGDHACAIVSGGAVRCWGRNYAGQLGDGSENDSSTPVDVVGVDNAISITAGTAQTCAGLAGGAVMCWGRGPLGDDEYFGSGSAIPVAVVDIDDAVLIDAGDHHTCAIVTGGAVKCWGEIPGRGRWTVPVQMEGISGVLDLAAGRGYTCAIELGGRAICWVNESVWELEPDGAVAIAIDDSYPNLCVLKDSGAIRCRGGNEYGQLGIGTTSAGDNRVDVIGIDDATAIAVGAKHNCAKLADESIVCWGAFGAVGNGFESYRSVPVVATGAHDLTGITGGSRFDSGRGTYCATLVDGQVTCWGHQFAGYNFTGPQTVPGLTNARAISGNGGFFCAIVGAGRVKCWGGLPPVLGNPQDGHSDIPIFVPAVDDAVGIATGREHACVILHDGSVTCWGGNPEGQLGIDDPWVSSPMAVPGVHEVSAIAAASNHTCAVLTNGEVECWGTNNAGELGTGDYENFPILAPTRVAGVEAASAIDTGTWHTCAVTEGKILCWGRNSNGQLGDGTTQSSASPVQVLGIEDATAVAVGDVHSCALVGQGAVRCWGDSAMLGSGTPEPDQQPATVVRLRGATDLFAFGDGACALVDGVAHCWGFKGYNSLGDNSSIAIAVPHRVVGSPFSFATDVMVFAEDGSLSNASISPFGVRVNRSAASATGRVHLTASMSPTLVDPVWVCEASSGNVSCNGFGEMTGDLDLELSLPPGGDIQFRLMATVDASRGATAAVSAHLEDAGSTNAFPAIDRDLALPVVGGVDDGDRRRFPGACSGTDSPRHADCEAARVNRSILQHSGRR